MTIEELKNIGLRKNEDYYIFDTNDHGKILIYNQDNYMSAHNLENDEFDIDESLGYIDYEIFNRKVNGTNLNVCQLNQIYVEPEVRHNGIGTAILTAIESHCVDEHVSIMFGNPSGTYDVDEEESINHEDLINYYQNFGYDVITRFEEILPDGLDEDDFNRNEEIIIKTPQKCLNDDDLPNY